MTRIEDTSVMRPFINKLEDWGCQVLDAINRPNPYRGGFSIIFRCEETTARAIADLGLVHILVDVRAYTYQLRLPEIHFIYDGEGQPELRGWTDESKRERLDEILVLWNSIEDIHERRKARIRLFYKND